MILYAMPLSGLLPQCVDELQKREIYESFTPLQCLRIPHIHKDRYRRLHIA